MTVGTILGRLFLGVAAVFATGCATPESHKDSATVFLPEIVSSATHHEALDYYSAEDGYLLFTRASLDYAGSSMHESWIENGERKTAPLTISDSGYDADVVVSPHRSVALFTSTRISTMNETENWNLWIAASEFVDGRISFGPPTPLPAPVNSGSSECCAVFVSDTEFLFASDRTGNWDIYRAKKTGDDYRVLAIGGDVNSDHGEWPNQYVGDTGVLLFSSIRPDGVGGDDIYVSRMDEDGFIPPTILPAPVNSPAYEDNAFFDGATIFWSSRSQLNDTQPQQSDVFMLGIDAREDVKRLLLRGE